MWSIEDKNIYKHFSDNTVDRLPLGVYSIKFHPMVGVFLERVFDKFDVPEKIYGNNSFLIGRIKKRLETTGKNTGIFLQGSKGSGKTLFAKTIANEMELPTIIIDAFMENLAIYIDFLKGLTEPFVLLIDEYEKKFVDKGQTGEIPMLEFLDGTGNNKFITILTSNSTNIHYALKDRCSRLVYWLNFDKCTMEQFNEIVEDKLENKENIPTLLELWDCIGGYCIDNLMQVIAELNMFGDTSTEELLRILNLSNDEANYKVELDLSKFLRDEAPKPIGFYTPKETIGKERREDYNNKAKRDLDVFDGTISGYYIGNPATISYLQEQVVWDNSATLIWREGKVPYLKPSEKNRTINTPSKVVYIMEGAVLTFTLESIHDTTS